MIYVCIPSYNDADTVGLLLWKIRRVFDEFPREYHLLVADDCSGDATASVLEPYERSLPLSVIRHSEPRGYARSVEVLLRDALRRSDRHKRDLAVLIDANFTVSPDSFPEMIRRFESGADLVVGELAYDGSPVSERLVRRSAPLLLRPGVKLPGIRDLISGCAAFRLITIKHCFRNRQGPLLETEGWAANAELIARAASEARQICAVQLNRGPRTSREMGNLTLAVELFRAGRTLRVPAPEAELQRVS